MNIPSNKIKNTLSLLASYLLGVFLGAFVIHMLEILKVKYFHIHPNAIWWELKKVKYIPFIKNMIFIVIVFFTSYTIITILLKQVFLKYPSEHPRLYHSLRTVFIFATIFILCVVCESKDLFYFLTASFSFQMIYSFVNSFEK